MRHDQIIKWEILLRPKMASEESLQESMNTWLHKRTTDFPADHRNSNLTDNNNNKRIKRLN